MTIARAVFPASWTLGTAVFLLMLSFTPVAAQSPQAAEAIRLPAAADIAVSADALRVLKVRLVTAILIALSGSPTSSGSQAALWSQVRAGAGTADIAERTTDRSPEITPIPQLMTASSSSD